MVDADDYEALPEYTPFHIVAAAGAAAGVAEHCVMYPVDSVKVCCLEKRKILWEHSNVTSDVFGGFLTYLPIRYFTTYAYLLKSVSA